MKRFLFVSKIVDEDDYYTTITGISLSGAIDWDNVEHREENQKTQLWAKSAEVGDCTHCWDGVLVRLRDSESLGMKKETIFDRIKKWWRHFCWIYENDPVKKCPERNCIHVDGMLCNSEYCDVRRSWETKEV